MLWLALGAFAIGTETFMIAGILPVISGDLDVSVATAGYLVTAFALAYAVGSPVMATITAGLPRRVVLITAMVVFGLANLVAAAAPDFGALLASRILLALAAATFMPAASAYAAAMAAPEHRGRALAVVYAGMTVAMILGVPAGTLLANQFDWRAPFIGVAGLAALAVTGIALALRDCPGMAAVGLRQRLAVARRRDILSVLLLTTATLAGAFSINTYFGAFLQSILGVSPNGIALFFLLIGSCGAIGNFVGGYAADHWDRTRYLTAGLLVLAVTSAALPIMAGFPRPTALVGIGLATVLSGLFGWSILTVQQVRLVSIEPALAPIALSLNSSAIYLGSALGSVSGAIMVDISSVREVGWVGAMWSAIALLVLLVTTRRRAERVVPT